MRMDGIDPVNNMVETLRIKNNEFANVCRKMAGEIQTLSERVNEEPSMQRRSTFQTNNEISLL